MCGSDDRYPWEGSGLENEGTASWELLHRPKRIFRLPKDQGQRRGTGRPTLEVVLSTSPGARETFQMFLWGSVLQKLCKDPIDRVITD